MIEWKDTLLLCGCGKTMSEVKRDGELIAISCRCGLRLVSEAEYKRMRQHQKEVEDAERGKRLEFSEHLNPYVYQSRTKWVKSGHRRRLKVKKLFILAGIAFVIASLVLLIV